MNSLKFALDFSFLYDVCYLGFTSLKGKVSFDEFNKIIDENLKEQERIQNNMTDKLIRNFRRIEYQLGDVRIVSYPKDIDSMMHLKIDGEPILSDNILNVIYNDSEKEYKK